MASARVKIGDGGRLVIPAEYRKALDLRVGDEVELTLEDNRLRIDTVDAAIQRLQELVSQYVPRCFIGRRVDCRTPRRGSA